MKTLFTSKLRFLATASLMAASAMIAPAFGQTTATTDPVGFITLNVVGGGTPTAPKYSLVAPTLMRPVDWQGSAASPIAANVIAVAGTPWSANQFNGVNGSYFVEVITGSAPGVWANITATAPNTVTTDTNLSTVLAVGNSIRIRKHITIADVFGAANSAGLLASDDPTTADEVQIFNGALQTSYFYFTGAPGFPAGWWDSNFTAQAGGVAIAPYQGIVVKRKAVNPVSIVSTGAVKTGNTMFPVNIGQNVLGTVSAKGLTLATSGLFTGNPATGVKGSDDPTTADEVTLYGGSVGTSYFYFTGAPGFPAGWYDSGFNGLADAVVIAPGTSLVISRKAPSAAFTWPLPSPSSF